MSQLNLDDKPPEKPEPSRFAFFIPIIAASVISLAFAKVSPLLGLILGIAAFLIAREAMKKE